MVVKYNNPVQANSIYANSIANVNGTGIGKTVDEMCAVMYHTGKFPPKHLDWEQIVKVLEPASAALARYDSLLSLMDNSSLLLSPMTTREAVLSSKIEGTQATVADVLEFDAGIEGKDETRINDVGEVVNYRTAMAIAEKKIGELEIITGRTIREIHECLVKGVRGKYKSPGVYRTEQNWIGVDGTSIGQARYVPISPDCLQDGMRTWEHFVNEDSTLSLIKTAIAHVEFEALHPFLDGNGRLGRMLIPLMLWNDGVIEKPNFYISAYFETNRKEYQDRLLAVSEYGKWTEWCIFFLTAVENQAKENCAKAQEVFKLHAATINNIHNIVNSKDSIPIVDSIFRKPIFSLSDIAVLSGVETHNVRRIIGAMVDSGIVRVLAPSSGRSPAVYLFEQLMAITDGL